MTHIMTHAINQHFLVNETSYPQIQMNKIEVAIGEQEQQANCLHNRQPREKQIKRFINIYNLYLLIIIYLEFVN